MSVTTTELLSAATSGRVVASTFTASSSAADAVLGGANNDVALIRFDSSSITSTDRVLRAALLLTFSAVGADTPGVSVWMAKFGATINASDARRSAAQPKVIGETFRMECGIAVADDEGAVASATVTIPTRHVTKGASGTTDFEIRAFKVSGGVRVATSGAGETRTLTIDSASASRPKLTVVHCTEADILDGTARDYFPIGLGDEAYVAFGIEPGANKPVKATSFVDVMPGISLTQTDDKLFSAALRRARSGPYKWGDGLVSIGGGFSFELTAEVWTKLLLGIFELSSTSGSDPYTHVFKPTKGRSVDTFTIFRRLSEEYVQAYTGMGVNTLGFTANVGDFVRGSVDFVGMDSFLYDQESIGDDDEMILSSGAGYDAGYPFTFSGINIEVNDSVDPGDANNLSVSIGNGLGAWYGFNNERTPNLVYAGPVAVGATFDMVFSNVELCMSYLSMGQSSGLPARSGKAIQTEKVEFIFAGPDGVANQMLKFEFPKAIIAASPISTGSNAPNMLSCSLIGAHDSSAVSNIVVTLVNGEVGTTFSAPTYDRLTVLPEGVLYVP